MVKLFAIVLLTLAIQSCQYRTITLRKKFHPVPASFDDTLNAITDRLQKCQNCNYIIYEEKAGNCFGASLNAWARIIWSNGQDYYYWDFSKEAREKKVTDKSYKKDSKELFEYFSSHRIDTITTLPSQGGAMDPASFGTISVKIRDVAYQRKFELMPFFTSRDTLHPLYIFVKQTTDR